MGFYGDFQDRRQVAFQFDRVFNNRKSMDTLAETGKDGVFAGRFVLVKYDSQGRFFEGDIPLGYFFNNIMYLDYQYTVPYIYTTYTKVSSPNRSDWASYYYYNGSYYFKLPNEQYFDENETEYYIATTPSPACIGLNQIVRLFHENFGPIQTYYKCVGSENNVSGEVAKWEPIYHESADSEYLRNYNIDRVTYGINADIRGYDATIWEKVYTAGKGSFILVARLNGSTPAMELYPDPPKQLPAAPYIDNLSSDVYYRIHVPSMYGFQLKEVKETDDFVSDQRERVLRYRYNNSTESYTEYQTEIDAGVYFNAKGNNYQTRYIDTTTPNYVKIEPTGESGRVYYDANGNVQRKDIMEISFSFPAIGNMIATGYDLMYGAVENNEPRKIDVSWINGNAPDELKHNEDIKSYNKNSLAGTVNIAHDILGQIIVPLDSKPSPEQVEAQLSEDYIYQIDDTYYRKGLAYDIEIIDSSSTYIDEDGNTKYMLEYVNKGKIPKSKFQINKYFIVSSGQYVEARAWDPDVEYWVKSIVGARYTPIKLTQFNKDEGFYYQDGERYMRDNSAIFPLYPERTYYKITIAEGFPKHFTQSYSKNGLYLKLENNCYIHPTEDSPELGKTYYSIRKGDMIETPEEIRFYIPGFYHYYNELTGRWERAMTETLDMTKQYAVIVYDAELTLSYDITGMPYYEHKSRMVAGPLNPTNSALIQNPLSDMSMYYYEENDNFYTFDSLKDIPEEYGVQHPATRLRKWKKIYNNSNYITPFDDSTLYIKNKYYTMDSEGNFEKSKGELSLSTYYYYLSSIDEVEDPFYLPNVYWYNVSGSDEYTLGEGNYMIENVIYNTKAPLYVYSDSLKQCPYGYEWSDYVNYIPPSIVLYYKKPYVDLIPIQGLINGENSIYGQALAMHKMFGLNDKENRNSSEIRGAFNILQDILYLIKTVKPGRLLFVNDMGQIESTDEDITIDKLKALLS